MVRDTEDGVLLFPAGRGNALAGYEPATMTCEARGHTLRRQKTYVVEAADGKLIQVGSSCVKRYFGVVPEGLWALDFDPLERAEGTNHWTLNENSTAFAVPTEDALAYALAVSDGGDKFVGSGEVYHTGGQSTADVVKEVFLHPNDEILAKSEKWRAEAQRLLTVFREERSSSNSYLRNRAVVATSPQTRWRELGILVSGVTHLAREKREQARLANAPSPGFLAPVGTKLKGEKLKVYKTFSSFVAGYTGYEEEHTRVIFRDQANHEIVWWASRPVDLPEGTEIEITSGQVKRHGNFQGNDQTILTRLRFKE